MGYQQMMDDVEREIGALKAKARELWDRSAGKEFLERARLYIENLLPREVDLAHRRGRLPSRASLPGGCDQLVLLVGFSIEPLLQAICAYQPSEVVPVLNRAYGSRLGTAMRDGLQRATALMAERGLVSRKCEVRRVTPLDIDAPSAVFHFLREVLKGCNPATTVIDITGGKKSMVAGAFVFAAYSNTPISYVDFDDYDEDGRRPYGCTCRIDLIDNPVQAFRLGDWMEVRRLYCQYAFAAGHDLLGQIVASMEQGGYFAGDQIVATRTLADLLVTYAAWDNGDYARAARLSTSLPDPVRERLPSTITRLAQRWPDVDDAADAREAARQLETAFRLFERGEPNYEGSFYMDVPLLLAYADDELARIDRLIRFKNDCRSALLRSDGLVELLLEARLFVLWKTESLTVEVGTEDIPFVGLPSKTRREYYLKLFERLPEPTEVLMALRWEGKRGERVIKLGRRPDSGCDVRPAIHATKVELEKFWEKTLDISLLRQLRNKASHACLTIPPNVARAALEVAAACRDDFMKRWVTRLAVRTTSTGRDEVGGAEPMSWDEACAACGVDFLPPRHGGSNT